MTHRSLHARVAAQAARTPDATALVFGPASMRYETLDQTASQIARTLMALGCERGDRVCLFVQKSPQAVAAMLGTLKAGCAYVPIDLDSPATRARRIVAACEPAVCVVDAAGMKLLGEVGAEPHAHAARILSLEPLVEEAALTPHASRHDIEAQAPNDPGVGTEGSALAHILFTSGSTGTPKGVTITHDNVLAFLDWACPYFGLARGQRISGHPPLHFDLSTFDIYGSLGTGATLHLLPPQLNLLPQKLAAYIRDEALTQWFSVPSILTYMAKFDVVRDNDFPELKRLLWCGEVLPTSTLIYFMHRLPHVKFTNLYGPTEATIASSFYTVARCPADERAEIPIGAPCGGEFLEVLDDTLEPRREGEVGDLYIGGAGLSPGYWRDEHKTAEAFRRTGGERSVRVYRTGDLGRRGADGLFYYHGRVDSQIKSRGYRIELREIEVALDTLGELRESAVVGVETGGFEGTAICCAYVPNDKEDPACIREGLQRLVPKYMVPHHWKAFDALPKNANGKIDRRRIRELFELDLQATGTAA